MSHWAVSETKQTCGRFIKVTVIGIDVKSADSGHRRTYVGAMPGLIIQGLRKCGVNNPLFLLGKDSSCFNERETHS